MKKGNYYIALRNGKFEQKIGWLTSLTAPDGTEIRIGLSRVGTYNGAPWCATEITSGIAICSGDFNGSREKALSNISRALKEDERTIEVVKRLEAYLETGE